MVTHFLSLVAHVHTNRIFRTAHVVRIMDASVTNSSEINAYDVDIWNNVELNNGFLVHLSITQINFTATDMFIGFHSDTFRNKLIGNCMSENTENRLNS